MNWDRRSRPDMIMRDSSAAICHRYEGGASREIERERHGGREEGGKCRPSVRQPCHRPTITQASGLQFNMKPWFVPVTWRWVFFCLIKEAEVGHKTCALEFLLHEQHSERIHDVKCREVITAQPQGHSRVCIKSNFIIFVILPRYQWYYILSWKWDLQTTSYSHTSWRRGHSRWVHCSSQRPLVLKGKAGA